MTAIFLWPYALAALVGVPAAVLIALWRARRRRVRVASLLLWQSLARKLADSGRKRKTIFDLPLVLAAASALLLGIAAAGPVLSRMERRGRTVLMVLDRSASMTMQQNGVARWELARREAHRLLDELSADDRVCIAASPPTIGRIGPIRPISADEARKLLDTLQPADRPASITDDLARAMAAANAFGPSSTVVFTDDPAAVPSEARGATGAVSAVSVGGPADNVFFTRLGFSGDDGRTRILLGVMNSGGPRDITLSLAAGGGTAMDAPPLARSIHLDAGAEHTEIFDGDFENARFVAAKIEPDDALAADNLIYAVRATARPVRVLLLGRENSFIESALGLHPSVELVRGAAPPKDAAGAGQFDLAVCNGVTPGAGFPCMTVAIDPPEAFGSIGVGRPADNPKVTMQAAGSVLDDTGLAEARIGSARAITAAATARVLAASDKGPVVVEDGTVICFGFAFDQSNTDWPLRPGFPIFWAKVLERISPDGRRGFVSHLVGQEAAMPPGDSARRAVRIQPERGAEIELSAEQTSFAAELAGLYELDGQQSSLAAFNLLDASESSTKGTTGLFTREMIKEHVPGIASKLAAGRTTWRVMNLILAAGVASLLAQWYLKR